MNENIYKTAGLTAIAVAVIFPIAWELELVKDMAFARPPQIDLADFLFLLFAALSIYALLRLRHLLSERYAMTSIGGFILASIVWHAVFFGGSFLLEILLVSIWPSPDLGPAILLGIFYAVGLVVIGAIDLIIGAKIIRSKVEVSELVRVYGWLSMVIGFFEVTVIFSFVNLLLVPVAFVVLALLFFKRPEHVEFV